MKNSTLEITPRPSVTFDRTDGHIGNFLIMVAETYPYVLGLVLESIQNSLDVRSKNIWIRINQKVPGVAIRDDGEGASIEKFREALKSIGKSIKSKDKLGRFGRGLISPLDKCRCFKFTSSPQGRDEYNEWTFVRKDIEASTSFPNIQRRSRTDITNKQNNVERGITLVGWNTEVLLIDVMPHAKIHKVTIEELTQAILGRFSRVLLRLDATVNIVVVDSDGNEIEKQVKASTCTGHKLEEVVIGRRGEQTVFSLFRALKASGTRKGKILVGESDDESRIPLNDITKKFLDDGLVSQEAAAALASGVFEGEITSQLLKLQPSRRDFVEGDNLIKFCLALDEWYKHVGHKHMLEAAEERDDEMYQDLGRTSLKYIEDLVMSGKKDYADFRKVIESLKVGSVGSGHKKPKKRDIVGQTEELAIAAGAPVGSTTGDSKESGSPFPKTEHEEHHPFTVQGPRGRTRTLVKGGSTGLQFRFVEMQETASLWEFDTTSGELRFNTRSAAWLICKDKGPKHLRQLMETVALLALTLEIMPDGWRDGARALSEEFAKPFAEMITLSDAFQARMKH